MCIKKANIVDFMLMYFNICTVLKTLFINAEKHCLVLTPVNVLFVSCQQEREQVSEKDGKEVKKREKERETH